MIVVGAFEAKTRLSALLEKVEGGEEVVITKRGKPIARLAPVEPLDRGRIAGAIARIRELAKGQALGGLSVRAMREEGRR
jgi:prevent-host-death family protein